MNGSERSSCHATKQKIADTLRQLMLERPFQKITVQNLMDISGMKRQSFYYHFQDTRDVLQWICTQELLQPLAQSDLDFENWLFYGLELLEKDRGFYRRVFSAGNQERIVAQCEVILAPRVTQLLFSEEEQGRLEPGQQFAVGFLTRAVFAQVQELVQSRRPLDMAAARSNYRYLMELLPLQRRDMKRN